MPRYIFLLGTHEVKFAVPTSYHAAGHAGRARVTFDGEMDACQARHGSLKNEQRLQRADNGAAAVKGLEIKTAVQAARVQNHLPLERKRRIG